MAFSRKYDKRTLTALIRRVKKIDKVEIAAGFFAEDSYGPENASLPVAQVAWYNERGLGNMVPSRPFMEKTFGETMELQFYAAGFAAVFKDVLDQGRQTERRLKSLGSHVVGVMKMNIEDWPGSNSERWAAIKGFNDPLVHTKKMLNSVKFKVERPNA